MRPLTTAILLGFVALTAAQAQAHCLGGAETPRQTVQAPATTTEAQTPIRPKG